MPNTTPDDHENHEYFVQVISFIAQLTLSVMTHNIKYYDDTF